MAKRSYGSGRLFVVTDRAGRESWYGSWWAGSVRVKRKLGPKRRPNSADGLTRSQAERELRRRIETEVVRTTAARRSIPEAGAEYVDHLEAVMERKPSTIYDYRGYLRKHLEPYFRDRPLDRIEPAHVAAYLKSKRAAGLSAKTVQNHLNFLHGGLPLRGQARLGYRESRGACRPAQEVAVAQPPRPVLAARGTRRGNRRCS